MAGAFVPGLKALSSTRLKKTRELPIQGRALVKVGDSVSAATPVLEADLPGNLYILRISEKLGIEAMEAMTAIKNSNLKIGAQVKEGQILCEHSGLFGLFKSRFVSPSTGVIEYISETNAHIGVREPSVPLQVNAYLAGKVVNIVDGKSVTIESSGAYIQGIFGVGGERVGEIKILKISADKILSESDIPTDCTGLILVGGTSPSADTLGLAAKRGAVGLVCGAIDDAALTAYLNFDLGVAITGDEDITMSVIVTEGFGKLPISEKVLEVLSKFDGHEAAINGATQVRAGAIRPEVLVVHNENISNESQDGSDLGLDIGQRIRIIRVPYFGIYGSVVELPQALATIETGAMARILKAKLDDGRTVSVPRANVEIVSQ